MTINARDTEGKSPLYYWQEPRYREIFQLRRWEPRGMMQNLRKQRAEITEVLASVGATL